MDQGQAIIEPCRDEDACPIDLSAARFATTQWASPANIPFGDRPIPVPTSSL